MFGLGAGEIFVITVLALIFIGPKKLPELARGLGKGIREFQRAKSDLMDEVHKEDADKIEVAKTNDSSQHLASTIATDASDNKIIKENMTDKNGAQILKS